MKQVQVPEVLMRINSHAFIIRGAPLGEGTKLLFLSFLLVNAERNDLRD